MSEAEVDKRGGFRVGSGPTRFTLMNRAHEIANCVYDPALMRFTAIEVFDYARAPLVLTVFESEGWPKLAAINVWWGRRAVPGCRRTIGARLARLGLQSTFELPFLSLGLSLSDQYWLRPEHADLTWEKVNFFKNDFEFGPINEWDCSIDRFSDWLSSVGLNSPDNTTEGILDKRWLLGAGGCRYLIKGNGESGREAYNEVIATMLHRRLLPASAYVEYWFDSWRGHDVCACGDFLRDDEEFVPAWQILGVYRNDDGAESYKHYVDACGSLGALDAGGLLDRMIVCDSVLANTDRHWGNFGLIRNVETLEYRSAPIFDSGSSLWSHLPIRKLLEGHFGFSSMPFCVDPDDQLRLVKDVSWYDPKALEGFIDEVRAFLKEDLLIGPVSDVICAGLELRIGVVNKWADHCGS